MLLDAFNQENALLGALSVILKTDGSFAALIWILSPVLFVGSFRILSATIHGYLWGGTLSPCFFCFGLFGIPQLQEPDDNGNLDQGKGKNVLQSKVYITFPQCAETIWNLDATCAMVACPGLYWCVRKHQQNMDSHGMAKKQIYKITNNKQQNKQQVKQLTVAWKIRSFYH